MGAADRGNFKVSMKKKLSYKDFYQKILAENYEIMNQLERQKKIYPGWQESKPAIRTIKKTSRIQAKRAYKKYIGEVKGE